MKIGSHIVQLTHEEKILFPHDGITKKQIIAYYHKIAGHMIPFTMNRPLTMQRYVNGIDQESFFQKDAGSYFPDWITKKSVKKKEGGTTHYVVCNNEETLVYLANQNCITTHLWLSEINSLHKPDRIIFDLDPSTDDFKLVIATALKIRELLSALGLICFAMTTGSRGVHVVIPIKAEYTFTKVKKFAQTIAKIIVADDLDNLTMVLSKKKRGSRLFIDTLRNQYGATAVAPYSIRAHDGAPVATPVTWDLLKNLPNSQAFNINTIFDLLKKIKEPWPSFFDLKQDIGTPIKLLEKIKKMKIGSGD